jgi:hypothetical protein
VQSGGPADTRLLRVLRQRTEDVGVKRHAVNWMKRVGSAAHTREALRGLHREIHELVAALGGHEHLLQLLARLDAQLDLDASWTLLDEGAASAPTGEWALTNFGEFWCGVVWCAVLALKRVMCSV